MTKIDQKIPEGWCVNEFSKIALLSKEKYIPSPNEHIKCLELEHFEKETGLLKGYIDSAQQSSAKNCFKKGDVLYGKLRSYLKKYTLAPFDGVCSTEIWVLRGYKEKLINTYLYLIIQTSKFNTACSVSTGTHMPRADWEYVSNIPFIYPPLAEQEKIAEILSCWDEGIEKLSALIEKKKLQKKALMQQLLTGKHRIKGFSTPWNEVKLEDVLYEHKETSKGDETICSVSVHKGIISQIEHLGRCFAASNTSNYNLVHYGDVVYTKSPTGEFPYGIFKQSQQRKSVIVSPLYGVFTPKTYYLGYILDVFFSYAINLNNYLKPIIQKGAKNTINITNETFLSKVIFLPEETKEIKKLAEIFIKSDEEIELLNKKLEAFKLEKKGLMQKLLTGQIRVKVN